MIYHKITPVKANEFVSAYELPSAEVKRRFTNDPLYSAIIRTESFQRLFQIAHLGSLSYLDRRGLKNTRGDHSIGVALLAYYFCALSELPKSTERTFVVSALLHDIHHLPFSHTMELALKNELKDFSLFDETQKIVFSRSKGAGQSIGDILHKFNIERKLLPLFKPKSRRPLIFGSTHNIDTLDGIIRAHGILFETDTQIRLLPPRIIEIMSEANSSQRTSFANMLAFDAFWEAKNAVYTRGIYDPRKVLFERVLSYYLFDLCNDKAILGSLTEYTDNDLLEVFPGLHSKIGDLWQYIRFACSSSPYASDRETEVELIKRDAGARHWDRVFRFMITTRQFTIKRSTEVVVNDAAALRRRYKIKPERKIII
ncbi:MAG: HD domain-containing protein, partial [Waddliaceae bacterium]